MIDISLLSIFYLFLVSVTGTDGPTEVYFLFGNGVQINTFSFGTKNKVFSSVHLYVQILSTIFHVSQSVIDVSVMY